jgi:hypothetical protein
MESSVSWNIAPYSLLKINRRFGGIFDFLLQGRRIYQARDKREAGSVFHLLHAGFLLGFLFDFS